MRWVEIWSTASSTETSSKQILKCFCLDAKWKSVENTGFLCFSELQNLAAYAHGHIYSC